MFTPEEIKAIEAVAQEKVTSEAVVSDEVCHAGGSGCAWG